MLLALVGLLAARRSPAEPLPPASLHRYISVPPARRLPLVVSGAVVAILALLLPLAGSRLEAGSA